MNTLRVSSAFVSLVLSAAVFAQDSESTAPAFETIDADNNGFITPAEVQDNVELTAMFGELDANGDGQLSAEEYGKQAEVE
jgi:Ca2+-binding EF-hand superfamily protein